MEPEQLSSYLRLLDLPLQLDSSPHPANLALIQSRHLMRIPYQSRDLHNHKNQPRPSLALDDLLSSLSIRGGHCYQHSELLYAALISLGYSVTRVGSWVLNGKELRQEMQKTHNILLVTIGSERFLVDTGFGPRSPRYPLCFSFAGTAEVECCEGERYRLEVSPNSYILFEQHADDSWFPLYAFPKDTTNNLPRTVTREETEQMFEELYTSKDIIAIRDVKMIINLQTVDSRINFMSSGESHTLKVMRKGRTVEEEVFETQEEMFKRVRQLNVNALGH